PVSKAALFNRVDAKRCVPGIEAANDNSMLEEVDHRSGAVDADKMRLANVAVRPPFGLAGLPGTTEPGH
ncbi:MAG: hypothetical protein OER77_05675, partial [Myxococcales bacterium]|nr:hypothetical protein [Myxococcales bacterium]